MARERPEKEETDEAAPHHYFPVQQVQLAGIGHKILIQYNEDQEQFNHKCKRGHNIRSSLVLLPSQPWTSASDINKGSIKRHQGNEVLGLSTCQATRPSGKGQLKGVLKVTGPGAGVSGAAGNGWTMVGEMVRSRYCQLRMPLAVQLGKGGPCVYMHVLVCKCNSMLEAGGC